MGLFLRGQIRRRRAVGKASAKAKAKAKAVKAASANTGKKKVRGKKLKKAKAEVEIESDPKNFRRNGVGVQLVEQQMQKAKHLDDVKFKNNTIFSESSEECRLKITICQGKKWVDVCKAALRIAQICQEYQRVAKIFQEFPRYSKKFQEIPRYYKNYFDFIEVTWMIRHFHNLLQSFTDVHL